MTRKGFGYCVATDTYRQLEARDQKPSKFQGTYTAVTTNLH